MCWLPMNLVLLQIILTSLPTSAHHTLTLKSEMGEYRGDILLGGLFPVHRRDQNGLCNVSKIGLVGMFSLEAFYYSLDLLNEDLKTCCGFSVGGVTLDTCMSERKGLLQALKFVIKRLPNRGNSDEGTTLESGGMGSKDLDVVGVVGPMASDVTVQVANLFGMFQIPQISYAATTPVLSNNIRYPYFLRTVPSDFQQASALLWVLKQWNWSYIIGVYEDSSYGIRGFQLLRDLAAENDICFADTWKIDIDDSVSKNLSHYEAKLKDFYMKKPRAKVEKPEETHVGMFKAVPEPPDAGNCQELCLSGNYELPETKKNIALVMYLTSTFTHRILAAAKSLNLDNHFIFIGSDGWGNRFVPKNIRSVAEGGIATHPVTKEFPGFRDYFYNLNPSNIDTQRNPWFKLFWESLFDCSLESNLNNCQKNQLAEKTEGTEFSFMHFVRDAVFAFGKALRSLYEKKCAPHHQKGICSGMRRELNNGDSSLLLQLLRNVTISGVDGETVMFVNGHDGAPNFSILNYVYDNISERYEWTQVATILIENHNKVVWKRNSPLRYKSGQKSHPESACGRPCPPGHARHYQHYDKCCWSCETCEFPTYKRNETSCAPCHNKSKKLKPPFYQPNSYRNGCEIIPIRVVGFFDPFIIGVSIFAGFGLLLTIITLALFIFYASTPIIKASGRELSLFLLFGIFLCYGNVFLVVLRPNIYSCALIRFLYSLSYTVCYAAIFIKTNRIARIFRVSKKVTSAKRTKYISPLSQLLLTGIIVGFQCLLNTVWIILRNPEPDYRLEIDYEQERIVVFYFCESFEDEDMVIALVFPVILLILSAIYALKARKCPGKFNETKYIILTTYTTCVVWLAFIPVFFTTGKIPVRVFALGAGQALNATVTIFCLFMPKLYVALCEPQKNTKDVVMGRKAMGSLGGWVRRHSRDSDGISSAPGHDSKQRDKESATELSQKTQSPSVFCQKPEVIQSLCEDSECQASPEGSSEDETSREKEALKHSGRKKQQAKDTKHISKFNFGE